MVDDGLTRQMHADCQKLRRSFLAMHLLASGDLRRCAVKDSAEYRFVGR